MGTAVEQNGGIALTLNGLDAAGIDYERNQDPPPEPASPFLAINDPRVENDKAPSKSPALQKENRTQKSLATAKTEKPKAETSRNEPPRGLRPRPQPARERPSPPVSPKTIPAKKPQDGNKKPIERSESKRVPNPAPIAKRSTAPTPISGKPTPLQSITKPKTASSSAKPSPVTPAATASPISPTPARKSRWKIVNFFRTPGPGPGPVSLPALQEKLATPTIDVQSPAPETPASGKPPPSAIKPLASATKSPASATKSPTSASRPAASASKPSSSVAPKKPRVPSQSLDPSPSGSTREAQAKPQGPNNPVDAKAPHVPHAPTKRDKYRSPTPPPKDEPLEIPELGGSSSGLKLLELDIPDISMERYSVMFSTVLQPRYSSLMLRRKANLEQLKVPDVPKLPEVYKDDAAGERASPKPQSRRQTVPSPKASPTLSLFPTIPPSIASRKAITNKPSPLVQATASNEDIPPLPSPKFFSSSEVAKAAFTRKATPQKLSMLSSTTRSSMSPESVKDRWTSDTSPTSTEATPTDEMDVAPGPVSHVCSSAARDSGASTYPFKLELPIMMPEPSIGRISPTPSRGREETKAESTKSIESSRSVPLKLETMPPTPEPAMFEPVGLDFTRLESAKSDPLKPQPLNVKPGARKRSPNPQPDLARDTDAITEVSRPPRSSSLRHQPRQADPASDADAIIEAPRPVRGSSLKRQPSLKRQASMKKQPPTPSASAPSPAKPILKSDSSTPVTASPRTIDIPKRKPTNSPLTKVSPSAATDSAKSEGAKKEDSAKEGSAKDGTAKDAVPPNLKTLATSASAQQLKHRTPQKLSSPVAPPPLTQRAQPTKTPSSSASARPPTSPNLPKSPSSSSTAARPDASPASSAPKLSDHPALRRAPSQSAKLALLTPGFAAPVTARAPAVPPAARPTSDASSIVAEVSLARQISLSRRQQVLTEVAPKSGGGGAGPGTPGERVRVGPEIAGGQELERRDGLARRMLAVAEDGGASARRRSERAVVEGA